MGKNMIDLTVIILTKNEELHLGRALENLKGFARDVCVVDSFSTDRTTEIATRYGARVYQNKFINYALQFKWALEHCDINTEWIMRLDADELIEEDLQTNLASAIPNFSSDIVGINLKRKHIFWGRWIKHGGRYPLVLLRVWRKGHGRIEERWMDEHMVVWGGKTVTIDGGFADHNLNDLSFFTDKHNKYATREALDVLIRKYDLDKQDAALSSTSASFQAAAKRWIKENLYNQLPFTLSSTGYFLFRYFLQLGFLDGMPGFVYHFLQGYWYRFLVGAKIAELEREITDCVTVDERKNKLAALTGHTI